MGGIAGKTRGHRLCQDIKQPPFLDQYRRFRGSCAVKYSEIKVTLASRLRYTMGSLSVFGSDELLKTVDELLGPNSPLAILNRRTNDAVGAVARQSRLGFLAGPLVRAFSSQTCEWVPRAAVRSPPLEPAAR